MVLTSGAMRGLYTKSVREVDARMNTTVSPKVRLGNHVDLLAGFAFKSARFTNDPDDIPLIKGENVGQGEILWNISKRWPKTEFDHYSRFELCKDDVVLAMDRPWVPAG